jgi:hypothetical protein
VKSFWFKIRVGWLLFTFFAWLGWKVTATYARIWFMWMSIPFIVMYRLPGAIREAWAKRDA